MPIDPNIVVLLVRPSTGRDLLHPARRSRAGVAEARSSVSTRNRPAPCAAAGAILAGSDAAAERSRK